MHKTYCRIIIILLLSVAASATAQEENMRIQLQPVSGKMMVNAVSPHMDGQVFGLGIPETIGCREHMFLVNHSDVEIDWETDASTGVVSTAWRQEGHMSYKLRIIPAVDYVDLEMTIANLSEETFHDVFAFNCISPARAPIFDDPEMTRTWISAGGKPVTLAGTTRIQGPRKGIGIYAVRQHADRLPSFAEVFKATSPDLSDGAWMVKTADSGDAYMAATAPDALFLFNNTQLGCIHAAPNFGAIGPQETTGQTSRIYFSKGSLTDFMKRYDAERGK